MIEYSDVYGKSKNTFHEKNPNKTQKPEILNFQLKLINKTLSISIDDDRSLEDLYTSIYNTVYPDYSMEKNIDTIPPAGISKIPYIYCVSIYNEKTDTILDVPIHKFISISSYMKSNTDCFVSNSRFGKPFYTLYVLDEYAMTNRDKHSNNKNINSLLQYLFSCYYLHQRNNKSKV